MSIKKGISEILKEADKAAKIEDKVNILRNNQSETLKILLRLAHDPNVKWLLPEGSPPFKATDAANDVQGRLYTELRRFYLFVEGGNPPPPAMPNLKRESLFIQLLESIDPDDARLLVAVKDKDLTSIYKTLKPYIINQAFPFLVHEKPEVVVETKKATKAKKGKVNVQDQEVV
jgi:hypothetical protein